jgi:SAM-dependent methyltransferase
MLEGLPRTMNAVEEVNTLTLSILEEAPAYHQWIVEKMRPWLGQTILEVGCGVGNLTGLLLRHGRVIPTDVNNDYLQIVANKFCGHANLKRVFPWDVRCPPPRELDEPIDSIVCSNVLEHIDEDEKTLGYFCQILQPGGRLILLVPALKWLYNGLDRELGHFRRYGKGELRQKLEARGFKIRHLSFLNGFGILGWFFNGTVMRRRLLPVRQVRIFNRLVPFQMRFEKIFPWMLGQSLVAIGEKGGREI